MGKGVETAPGGTSGYSILPVLMRRLPGGLKIGKEKCMESRGLDLKRSLASGCTIQGNGSAFAQRRNSRQPLPELTDIIAVHVATTWGVLLALCVPVAMERDLGICRAS